MTYTVYECDKIQYMQAPENEVAVATASTFREAADKAKALGRAKPNRSFTVGCSD